MNSESPPRPTSDTRKRKSDQRNLSSKDSCVFRSTSPRDKKSRRRHESIKLETNGKKTFGVAQNAPSQFNTNELKADLQKLQLENNGLGKIVDTLYEQVEFLKSDVLEKDTIITSLRQKEFLEHRWSKKNCFLDDLSSSLFHQALPYIRIGAKYFAAKLTYLSSDSQIRDLRRKIESTNMGPNLFTVDCNGANPMLPINIAQAVRYILPSEKTAMLHEVMTDFMKEDGELLPLKKRDACATAISMDKDAQSKFGRMLSEEWSGHRRVLEEEYFNNLGYNLLGSAGGIMNKKKEINTSWTQMAREASRKLLRITNETEDLSYWRMSNFNDVCCNQNLLYQEPHSSFRDDAFFKNDAAKLAFFKFENPDING